MQRLRVIKSALRTNRYLVCLIDWIFLLFFLFIALQSLHSIWAQKLASFLANYEDDRNQNDVV